MLEAKSNLHSYHEDFPEFNRLIYRFTMCGTLGIPDRPKAIRLHLETLVKLYIIESVVNFLMHKPDDIPFVLLAQECMTHVATMNPDCEIDAPAYIWNIIQREGVVKAHQVTVALYDEAGRLTEFGNSMIPLMKTIEHIAV